MDAEVVLKAVADGTRRGVLTVLHAHELNVSELVEVLSQPQSTVSRHLRVLREAGLIRDRRDGNTVLYSVHQTSDGGSGSDLSARLLEWLKGQPLPVSVRARLDGVIRARGQMSVRFFDRVGRQWDALREESFGTQFHLEAFLSLLPREWVVADIGTGTGYLLPVLARHFERVIGVDPVARMLDAARHRVEFHGLDNVDLRGGDLAVLPVSDASVDLAIASLVLHHVPAPRDALAELSRVVRPGGHILIVEQMSHRGEAFRERMQDRWWGFDPEELIDHLGSVGFADVRSVPLTTVERARDAPELFVVTGQKVSAPNCESTKRR